VRLRYGYVVECTGCDKDAAGNVVAVRCRYDPQTKSGTPGADSVKVKGNIHWVSAGHALAAEARLYDRLFRVPHPGRSSPLPAGGDGHAPSADAGDGLQRDEGSWLADLNPGSRKVVTAQLEFALRSAKPAQTFQFERHGYFTADRFDSREGAPVFNRAVTLRDSWKS
jgi:glutaminyl-tRNA synthetase